jgi:UDP-N-acetyl-D-glucosamine dehydrogenase
MGPIADIDAVIIQADHAEYSNLGPDDLPGTKVVYDGRGVLDLDRFAGSGVRVHVIGQGSTTL